MEFLPYTLGCKWAVLVTCPAFEHRRIACGAVSHCAKMMGVACPLRRWEDEVEFFRKKNVTVLSPPPCHHGFLLFSPVELSSMRHLAQMHWKRFPIDVSTIAKVETMVTTDVVVVVSLIIVRDAFEKLVVVSRELRNRHHEGRDVRFLAVSAWIQLMRCFWIRNVLTFSSVHPVLTDIGDAMLHPFGLDIWVPRLEVVSDIGCR